MLIVFSSSGQFVDSTAAGTLTEASAPAWWQQHVNTTPDPVFRWVEDDSAEAAHVLQHGGRGVSLGVDGGIALVTPEPLPRAWDELRAEAYAERVGPLEQQIDALFKAATFPEGSEAAAMQAERTAIKAEFPKPAE